MQVELVQWPAEADRRERLRAAGRPRLLVVAPGATPPAVDDCLEDWARASSLDHDLPARLVALAARARRHVVPRPTIDDDGLLRVAERSVALPPVELRLTQALVDRFGAVVGRDALARAGWPHGAPGRNALDVHVLRLRRRLASVGLSIRTVRSRGYLLEASGSGQQTVCHA